MTKTKDAFHFLFNPRSVAVIGASPNPLKMGHQCLLSLTGGAFPGPIYPIHHQEKEILGMPAYPDLQQVPGEVDLAILAVPASESISALQACQKKGVRGAVIITAGFREIDNPEGEKLQERMAAVASKGGIKIIGPNTFGMLNIHANLNASFTPIFSCLKPGTISVISQSGGVSHLIAYQALDEGVGLGKVIGLGNRQFPSRTHRRGSRRFGKQRDPGIFPSATSHPGAKRAGGVWRSDEKNGLRPKVKRL